MSELDYMSVPEIQRLLAEPLPVYGPLELAWKDLNVWFAFGVSREASDILQGLMD